MNRFVPAENLIPAQEEVSYPLSGDGKRVIENIRGSGREEFIKKGLPTTKVESWKYTDITPLTKMSFSFTSDAPHQIDNSGIKKLLPEKLSECTLVFVNGNFDNDLSDLPETKGIYIDNIKNIIESGNHSVLECISSPDEETDPFTNLNRANLNDGAVIRIGENYDPGFPIHLIYLSANPGSTGMSHPVNLIIAEAGSTISLIEEYTGDPDHTYFTNAVTEIHVRDNASVTHYKIQTESMKSTHIGTLKVRQGKDTEFASYTATFGGSLTRNNIKATMDGSGSSSNIEGLYFLKGDQHTDNHTEVFHNFPSCSSIENFNGVLDEESHAVFDGKIYVAEGAVQTDSEQISRSLLLSESASVDSKPALEIYADDVKCSHSASVGQLDADSLYYLRSRGLSETESMKILTSGFLKEILNRFKNESVSEKIENLLNSEIRI